MSKLDKISIQIGEETVSVPAWATEQTAGKIVKYSEASAKAINELLRMQNTSNKVARENRDLFNNMKKNVETQTHETEKQTKQNKKTQEKSNKITDTQEKAAKKLNEASTGLVKSVTTGDLKGLAIAVGGVIGLGNAAGFAVGLIEKFSESLVTLTNTGVGFASSLENLRSDAAAAGLDLENYGKVVSSNSEAVNALGENTSEGARNFSRLSREIRVSAREFNQFGMANKEFNEVILDEIELRRRAGESAQEIQDSLSNSMNDLILETSKLASLTGQDRREMLRNRQQLLQQPVIEAFRMRLEDEGKNVTENLGFVASVLGRGGETGLQFAQAITEAIALEQDIATVQQGMFAELQAIGGENLSSGFRDIFEFVRDNFADMPTDEFNRQLTSMTAILGESVTSEDLLNLSRLSSSGNQTATQLLTMIGDLQGLSTSVDENRRSQEQAAEYMRRNPMLALASTVEDLTNNLQASALEDVFNMFGEDFEESGKIIVDNFRELADIFADGSFIENIRDAYGELGTAATVLSNLLGTAAVIYGAGKLAKGGKIAAGKISSGTAAAASTIKSSSAAAPAARAGGSAASRAAGSAARMAGRALPFVGTGLYGYGAFNRFKEGDYGQGLLESAATVLSLIPGGGIPAAGLFGTSMALDLPESENTPENMRSVRERNLQRLQQRYGSGDRTSGSPVTPPMSPLVEPSSASSARPEQQQSNEERLATSLTSSLQEMVNELREANRQARRQTEIIENLDN